MKPTLFALALAVAAAAAAPALSETPIRFTLGWKTQGSDAPFLVALQKGYFKEEGLAVGIDQGEGSAATVTRIMGGAYDAGFGDINAIIQNAAVRPAESPVMVYQLWNRPPFAIVTPKSAGIEKPEDFHGKILGGAQGTPTTRLFPVFAELNGLDLSKIEIQNMAPNLQEPMLIRGEMQGAFVFTSTSWFNLIGAGQDPANDYRWFKFEDYGMDLYSNGLMVSQKLMAENPDAVAGLVRAVNRATLEVMADPSIAAEAIRAYDQLANVDLEMQRLDFVLTNLMNAPETATLGMGDLDDARLARSVEIVAKGYGLERLPAPGEIFNRGFLPPLDQRRVPVVTN